MQLQTKKHLIERKEKFRQPVSKENRLFECFSSSLSDANFSIMKKVIDESDDLNYFNKFKNKSMEDSSTERDLYLATRSASMAHTHVDEHPMAATSAGL